MHLDEFLYGAFIYLSAAVISVPIATRLGLGSVLGYLIAGIVIGPSVMGLIGGEGQDVMHFAELGVIVMLFLVGLELQPAKLWTLRRSILGLGALQVAGTAAVIAIAAMLFGLPWKTGLAVGLILAMSSTAIVIQSLGERGLLKTSAGQSIFSVLLFQDLAVIPILAVLPILAGNDGKIAGKSSGILGNLPELAQAFLVIAAVAGIVLAGRFVMRPLFRFIADTGLREIFVAFALLLVVAITLLMQALGLSPALGTFLAGVVLADNEYRHELEMDLEPFKGLLLAVFFIAVGAGIDFSLLKSATGLVAAIVFTVVAAKLAVLFVLARGSGMNPPESSLFTFSLAQGGEFAFVLISFATGLGLLAAAEASLLVAVVALSMALAPLLMIFDGRAIQPLFLRGGELREPDRIDGRGTRAIIAGHGRFGMTVGRVLAANGCKATVLDHDAEQIDALRRFGFTVFYGDASRLDLLEAAGAKEARALVIAIDDRDKALEIVDLAKRNFPHLEIFARAFDRIHAYELINAGVSHVYREVFGSSLDLAEGVLVALGKHPYEAARAVRTFKKHDEALLRVSAPHVNDEAKLIDISRAASGEIANVLAGDRVADYSEDRGWDTSRQTTADARSVPETADETHR
jgi:monovalent cation:proton antiporter-2 (CPA2) family protein